MNRAENIPKRCRNDFNALAAAYRVSAFSFARSFRAQDLSHDDKLTRSDGGSDFFSGGGGVVAMCSVIIAASVALRCSPRPRRA